VNTAPDLLILTDGFPREPDAGDWQQLTSMPGPRSLLEALFVEFSGVSLNDMPQTEDADGGKIDGDWQTRTIVLSKNGVGMRQEELKCIETSALPLRESVTTFGLPGLEVHWEYHLDLAGQLGHCAFGHDRLTARFDDDDVKQRFENIWKRIFDKTPVFQPS
jgi:hypothetical protein